MISLHAQVLHDDGSLLPALINCASLALVDAGVPVTGLVTSISCGLDPRRGAAPALGSDSSSGSEIAFDLLVSEEANHRVAGTYAFLGAPGPAGPVFTRQTGLSSWEDTRALLDGGALAAGTVLAFLRLAVQRKVARDAVNFGVQTVER